MNQKPFVSVVVPIYNVESYLKKCLESIQDQTYKNFEVLLIDDGSPGNEQRICQLFTETDLRFHYYRKENGGLSDARNYALDKLHGEYVTFIDSDDYVESRYLEHLVGLILKYKYCDIAVCSFKNLYEENGRIKDFIYPEKYMSGRDAAKALCYGSGVECYAWGKIYRCTLFEKNKFSKGRLFEDIDIMWKLFLQSENVAVGSSCDYIYRQRTGSILHSSFNRDKMILLKIMDEFSECAVRQFPELKAGVYRRKVFSEFWLLAQCMIDEQEHPDDMKRLIKILHRDSGRILLDKEASRTDKIKVLIFKLFGAKGFVLCYKFALKRNMR